MTKKVSFQPIIFLLIALFLFFLPLLTIFIKSFALEGGRWGLNNFMTIFQSERTLHAIKNTIIIALISTLISVVLGTLMAVLVAFTNVKHKKLLELLTLLPYVIPGYVITLSWTSLFAANSPVNGWLQSIGLPAVNMFSMQGIIFVMGLANTALVYLNLIDSLRKIPLEQDWASHVAGYGTWETLKNIDLKAVLPAIIHGMILSFLNTVDNFAVVSTLGTTAGINVLTTYIYEKAIGFGPSSTSQAAVLAVFLAAIAFTGIALQAWVLRKVIARQTSRPNYTPRIYFKHRTNQIVSYLLLFILFALSILPLLFMFLSSFQIGYSRSIFDISNMGLKNYQFILTSPSMYRGFLTSLTLTLLAIFICIGLAVWVAYYKTRINGRGTLLLEWGASLTFSTPGIVLALCMILYWSQVPHVYGTMKILLIAYVTRYLLIILNGAKTAMAEVPKSLEEAAAISGSKAFQKWTKIMIPLITKQIFSSSFLMFTAAFTELTLSSLLAAANSKTVGLTIFNLQTGGDNNVAQAYSVIITLFVVAMILVRNYFERKEVRHESTRH